MGVSTDAQICYGILLEEYDERLPKYMVNDIDTWWYEEILGYTPPFEIYDENGRKPEYENNKEAVTEYFKHRRDFEAEHPLPFELVNYCHSEVPMYIVAMTGSLVTAHRGHPRELSPTLMALKNDNEQRFLDAVEKYLPEVTEKPTWWLSSYWSG